MSFNISISANGVFFNNEKSTRHERSNKGKSIIDFPDDYIVLDLETTGLEPQFDNIIEFAALKVRGGAVVDTFQTLIKPYDEIDDFITELTGITNEMLSSAPMPETVFPRIKSFVGDDIVVGHNVNFDINFLYDWFETILKEPFTNNYIDTMRISRKVFPELSHHRLKDISDVLKISPNGFHRALCDCQTTFDCFIEMQKIILSSGSLEDFISKFTHHKPKLDLREITSENTEFDETHPLYGKHCVFTGTLEKMQRSEAAQLVVNVGGICDNGITKKTNYLILGNNDYCKTIKDGKSSKQKKAEEYKLNGYDIDIISESVFYDMLEY